MLIRVESPSLFLAVAPVVRILDADGKPVARAEQASPNVDVETTFTPPADGAYGIEVGDLYKSGSPRHAYRLRVVPVAPDFELTVATDRLSVSAGKPLDIPVTVTRKNGFAGEIELSVEGLPPGLTAGPVAKPVGKTVTLRITADKKVAGGPVRIVGRPVGKPSPSRQATSAVAEFDTRTADLWLTVTDAGAK